MTNRCVLLLTWLAAALPSPALAQKVGPEFLINTYTSFVQHFPSLTSDPSGNFVVVWASYGQDGSKAGIFGQRYDRGLNRLGEEFQINTETRSSQTQPAVASDASGDFVVVWEPGYGQRYDKDGNRLGDEFAVSQIPGSPFGLKVASDVIGDFVVVWQVQDGDGSGRAVFGQRFDMDGNHLGETFQVNTYTTNDQQYPAVASDANGNFIVVWESFGQDGWFHGIFGQRYDSNGSPLGVEFQVNTYTTEHQRIPTAAIDADGNFVVVWSSGRGGDGTGSQDGSFYGAFGQRFYRDGRPLGEEFQVNTYTKGSQATGDIAFDANGNFVVVWSGAGQGDSQGIFGQRYDSDGNPISGEFQVNTYTNHDQRLPKVASDPASNFVVVWASEDGGNGDPGYGIFGQRLCESTTCR